MEPLLVRAIKKETTERPPVWLMRQAGRYLPEYLELKKQHGFLGLCKNPELALEVTLQPIRRFQPDAAIVFADILLPGQSMGLDIEFNPGPKVGNPIRTQDDILALKKKDPQSSLGFVLEALTLLKKELAKEQSLTECKALIGFAGAPWTLACYFVDQGPFKSFHGTQVFAAQDPKSMHLLLQTLTEVITDFVLAQVESGADVIQLFDTWAGNLTLDEYRTFALPYTQQILEQLRQKGSPTILYINGSSHLLRAMIASGTDCVSIDWRTDLSRALEIAGQTTAVQGNFNPAGLFSTKDIVARQTKEMLAATKGTKGYIANLGHGVLPTTPPENVQTFIESIKEGWSTQ